MKTFVHFSTFYSILNLFNQLIFFQTVKNWLIFYFNWRRTACSRRRGARPSSFTDTTKRSVNWNWRHLERCCAAFSRSASSCYPCASSISDFRCVRWRKATTASALRWRRWFLTSAKRRSFTPFTGPSFTSRVVANSAAPSLKSNCPLNQLNLCRTSELGSPVVLYHNILYIEETGASWHTVWFFLNLSLLEPRSKIEFTVDIL